MIIPKLHNVVLKKDKLLLQNPCTFTEGNSMALFSILLNLPLVNCSNSTSTPFSWLYV